MSTSIKEFRREEDLIINARDGIFTTYTELSYNKLQEMKSLEDYYEIGNNETMAQYGMDVYEKANINTSTLLTRSESLMTQLKSSYNIMDKNLDAGFRKEFNENQPKKHEFIAFQDQQNGHKESFKGQIHNFLNKSKFATDKLRKMTAFTNNNRKKNTQAPQAKPKQENHYDVLGIGRDATLEQIKKAYRKEALIWHPDKNSDPSAEDRFKKINAAHECLEDSDQRKAYDQKLSPFYSNAKHSNHPFGANNYGAPSR